MCCLLMVQPFGHIPTDMIVRLQFHIIVPCNEINLSRMTNVLALVEVGLGRLFRSIGNAI